MKELHQIVIDSAEHGRIIFFPVQMNTSKTIQKMLPMADKI